MYLITKFKLMIAYGGTINCSWKFHSIKVTVGENLLYIPIISIQMVCLDVVLGVQCLQSLEKMTLNFKKFS